MPFRVRRCHCAIGLAQKRLRHGSWRNGISDHEVLAKTFRVNGFLISGGHTSQQFKCRLLLPELPGSIAQYTILKI
jgi:hypothetical protein